MYEMLAACRVPGKVVLNHNAPQFGLLGNVNWPIEVEHDDYIVAAAGDATSVLVRIERFYREVAPSGGNAMAVFSDMIAIDVEG